MQNVRGYRVQASNQLEPSEYRFPYHLGRERIALSVNRRRRQYLMFEIHRCSNIIVIGKGRKRKARMG